jgi:hypothetical protein
MKLEEILDEWEKDAKIDGTSLDTESLNIPSLHHKYIKIYSSENLRMKQLRFEQKEMELKKYEYYSGKLDQQELKELDWKPFDFKLLKQDIPRYLEADSDLRKYILKVDLQNEKLDLLKSILNTINNRSFQISNAIKWNAFLNGQ